MKKGFTLSEVLITLGIVGVVAVLTIPGVMKNYKNRLYTAQLQKAYSQISDAAQAIMNDEHVDNFYETQAITKTPTSGNECTAASNVPCYFLNTYFKPVKRNCGTGTNQCIASSYVSIALSSAGAMDNKDYCIQTTNGAAICGKYANNLLTLIIDVNGTAEPNMIGRDTFAVDIKSDGTVADFGSNSRDPKVYAANTTCTGNSGTFSTRASGCLTEIMNAGWKMEY